MTHTQYKEMNSFSLTIMIIIAFLFVTQFGKTEHNTCLLIFSYKPMFAKNIFLAKKRFSHQVII